MKYKIILLVISSIICIILSEDYLKRSGFNIWTRTDTGIIKESPSNPKSWYDYHSTLGWVFNKQYPIQHKCKACNFNVEYRTNDDGFRTRNIDSSGTEKSKSKRILILGDSNTFGWGVHEKDRFSDQLQLLLGENYETYNLAIPGWGFDQMYLAYKEYFDAIKPDVVIFTYINADLFRTLEGFRLSERLYKPSFNLVNGILQLRNPPQENKSSNLGERLLEESYLINYLYQLTYRRYLIQSINKAIVKAIKDVSKEPRLIFLKIPEKRDLKTRNSIKDLINSFTNYMKEKWGFESSLMNSPNIIFHDFLPSMYQEKINNNKHFFIENEVHLNNEAHAYIAKKVFEVLRNK
ncbi:MAG: SGNH/GDSL hydrolase family protein [Nitrospinae bacterium]|nr:SGNH/GDSL hydrolase family protein [Nitrospinota bacterium]